MKKSSIMLISGAGVLFLAVIANIVVMRVQVDQFRVGKSFPESGNDVAFTRATLVAKDLAGGDKTIGLDAGSETVLDYAGFDGLHFSGAWELRFAQGDAYEVRITAPAAGDYQIVTKRSGSVLDLSIRGRGMGWKGARASATIRMPGIASIRSLGALDANLASIETPNLSLDFSGGSNLTIASGHIGNLKGDFRGGYNIDLSKTTVTSASIDGKGAGVVDLNVDGGALNGDIDGAVVLNYSGRPSSVNVSASGMSSVNKN